MKTDIQGRVRNTNLPLVRSLLPLFECIVNSIHSIQEARVKEGRIVVSIERDDSQIPTSTGIVVSPIKNIEVTDNGTGFNEANYNSFNTADSRLKADKGGKGAGRFVWLKAFEKVEIESTFKKNTDVLKRTFTFSCVPDGVENHICESTDEQEITTKVKLNNFKIEYKKTAPKVFEQIALKIIEHCVIYFLQPNCPTIVLSEGDNSLILNDYFEQKIKASEKIDSFTIDNRDFILTYLRLYLASEHTIFLCADNREVLNEPLKNYIPDLSKRIRDEDGKEFSSFVYVTGRYLDTNVNTERTRFNFADTIDKEISGEISKEKIIKGSVECINQELAEFLEQVRNTKFDEISNFIKSKSPNYRYLLKPDYRHYLNSVPPGLNDERLEMELHQLNFRIESELKIKASHLMKTKINNLTDPARLKEVVEETFEVLEKESEIGKANLAKYIVHRKYILDLFSKLLEQKVDGKYELEEAIHGLIFPLRKTSDDIDFEQQNLWIIDEKLTYHKYLASDKKMSEVQAADIEGDTRSDLLIFDAPFAWIDEPSSPYQAITIIEFKKPYRKNYTEKDDNPITQVYNYIRKINAGTVTDKKGRPIPVNGARYYGYIICDITPKIHEFAINASLKPTPEGAQSGFFGYNEQLNCYIEIVSLDKILNDAKKRNRVLFDKLLLAPV